MGIINVLDFQVANLIAAGEVVDRPASAVKELLENSIDAGAKNITCEIKNGGVSFIRVCDDGKGMAREDVPVSLKRHATSKIKNASDLDGIVTLGFRGEALAAISSVSKIRIMTKTKAEKVGTMLYCEAGKTPVISDAGCPDGTTVIVEELFSNVPARRKFLKKDTTEAMAVSTVVEKIALSNPNIAIKFISDENMKFSTTGDGKLLNCIYSVFGRDFTRKISSVDFLSEGIEIKGYIGNPDNIKANRNYENFFINGRYVKSKTASAAIEQAFDSYIPSDKFPCCILNINIHPAFVDVNVHPAKLEVKFSDERPIFSAVYSAVRSVLEQRIVRPEFQTPFSQSTGDKSNFLNAFAPISDRSGNENKVFQPTLEESAKQVSKSNAIPERVVESTANVIKNDMFSEDLNVSFPKIPNVGIQNENSVAEIIPEVQKENNESPNSYSETKKELPFYKIIGEAFYSYVFVELCDKVLIIDKHAAHERIIFEELKKNMYSSENVSQILLVPVDIDMSSQEAGALASYTTEIKNTGFDFSASDNGKKVTITSVPVGIDQGQCYDMFSVILTRLSEGTGEAGLSRDIIYEKALYQASCKAAIKAGRMDSDADIKGLVEKLLLLDDIRYCPHGRPVAFEITKANFERQFKRT